MTRTKPIDPNHRPIRDVCRVVGPLLLVAGVVCIVVAVVDVFSASGSHHAPTRFWCFFLALPLVFVGAVVSNVGYMGRFARYVSQEMTPVAADTFNYAAKETRQGVREVAGAIREGLGGGAAPAVRCHKCNDDNDADAHFCSACGAALAKSIQCPDCEELNDPDARFCDNCGRTLGDAN